nr:BTB/POZ domain and ankyrin repeat-containing protein NPR1 [Tanacetum cinerariifolium]
MGRNRHLYSQPNKRNRSRVALANLLFPMQAKVAMEIAQVDGTSEFTLETAYSQNLANAQRTVDLNDAPFLIKEEHLVRKALQISKRLTRAVDYYKSTEEGKECGKGRLCIEILEQAERRNPLLGEASASLATAGDDLRVKLLYLENRGTEIWH